MTLDASAAQVAADEGPAGVRWSFGDGLRAWNGLGSVRVRTRLHLDLAEPSFGDLFGGDEPSFADPFESGDVGLRRARWLADFRAGERTLLSGLRARAQVDFARSEIDWKDLFARWDSGVDLGPFADWNVRAGQFRESFGFEAMSSVSHLPFIERSAATNAFTPGRSRGVQWLGRTDALLASLGHFRRADGLPFPNELRGESATTFRLAWHRELETLTQLGVSVSHRDAGGDGFRLGARPGTRLFERTVDTGTFDADRLTTFGVDALHRSGPWTAYAEAFGADADGTSRAFGGHLAVTRFVREGATTWKRGRGGLGAPSVPDAILDPFETSGGGAIELALRLGWIDLTDGPLLQGGESIDLEAGVNWYLAPATRFMLHWIEVHVVDGPTSEGSGSALLARLQIQI